MTSFQLTWRLVQAKFTALALFSAITISLSIFLEDQLVTMTTAQESERLILQLTMGLGDFAAGLILFFILSWALPNVQPWNLPELEAQPFSKPYLESFWAEYFRALAQILLWGLLLIIPGFIRYARLIFVPYIVLFSKAYRAGKVDALQLSQHLTRGRFAKILAVLILTSVLDVTLQLSPHFSSALHTYPVRIAFSLLSILISLWTYSFLFLVFKDAIQQRPS